MDSNEFGREGEEEAARYLKSIGFKILERSYSCLMGEIDIVASEGDVLVFVEVKARSTGAYGGALLAVTKTKQSKIVRAALSYIKARGLKPKYVRFDVVGIEAESSPLLVRNAFTPARYTY